VSGKFTILLLASCLAALAGAEAQSHSRSAVNSVLQRATERVQQISSASPDKGVPHHVLGAKYVAVIRKPLEESGGFKFSPLGLCLPPPLPSASIEVSLNKYVSILLLPSISSTYEQQTSHF